mgnify:CR=1 FL=1
MPLYNRLKEYRAKIKVNQTEMGNLVGVSRQTISKWELGETAPDIKQAQVLSQVFSVSLDELTGNDTKEVIYKKVSNTKKLAGLIIKVIKIWGIIILACLIVAVVGIVLFGFVRGEGSVEFANNVEKVTFTEVVGEETYIITIGSDGYFEGIGMSDEIKEELMELIVVGDLPTSEDNITDYFIKLREGTQQETP